MNTAADPLTEFVRTWSPVVSIGIALLALLLAIYNGRVARKALRLASDQEARRKARLDVTIRDTESHRLRDSGDRWIGIRLLIVNPTDRAGAIVESTLDISYVSDLVPMGAIITLTHSRPAETVFQEYDVLDVPVRLDANSAIDSWLTFEVTKGLSDGMSINGFRLRLKDSPRYQRIIRRLGAQGV